jgi:hypothetical protein
MTGVEAAELGGGVVAHQPCAVGGALQCVIVDDDKTAVRREMDVAFDQIAPGGDGGPERSHRVLRVLGRISAVTAQKRAAFVVCGFVAVLYRLSQAPVSLTAGETRSGVQQLLTGLRKIC